MSQGKISASSESPIFRADKDGHVWVTQILLCYAEEAAFYQNICSDTSFHVYIVTIITIALLYHQRLSLTSLHVLYL